MPARASWLGETDLVEPLFLKIYERPKYNFDFFRDNIGCIWTCLQIHRQAPR